MFTTEYRIRTDQDFTPKLGRNYVIPDTLTANRVISLPTNFRQSRTTAGRKYILLTTSNTTNYLLTVKPDSQHVIFSEGTINLGKGNGFVLLQGQQVLVIPRKQNSEWDAYVLNPVSVHDQLLFHDEFTDDNSVALTAHTPDYDRQDGGWLATTGTPDIQTNAANFAFEQGSVDVNRADVVITAMAYSGTLTLAVTANVSDGSNFWYGFWSSSSGAIEIYEVVAGTGTLRASDSGNNMAAGDGLILTTKGDTITLDAIGESLSCTYTVSNRGFKTLTKHGLGGTGSSAAEQLIIRDNS